MKTRCILFFLLIFFFNLLKSCKSFLPEEGSIKKILIDNTAIKKTSDISELIEEINVVSVKDSPGSYLGAVDQLYLINDKVIIFDKTETHKINLYNQNGTFIKTIIRPGDGPNNVFQINDCWLNYKGELEVYDFAQKKIYQFDTSYSLKKIIKATEFHIFSSLMRIPNSDNYVAYAGFDEYNEPYKNKLYHIAILDKKLSIINTDLFYDKSYQGIGWLSFRKQFYLFNDTIRFAQAYDNFIYNISNAGVTKAYEIVYKRNNLPANVLKDIVKNKIHNFKDPSFLPNKYFKDYTRFSGVWLENENYIYLSSKDLEKTPFLTLINKKKNLIESSAVSFCETKKYKIILPYFQYYDPTSKVFIGAISGNDLKDRLYSESVFEKEITNDPEMLYIVKVKLK